MINLVVKLLGGVRATIFASVAVVALAWGGWGHMQNNRAEARHQKMVSNLLLRSIEETDRISDKYEDDLQTAKDKRAAVERDLASARIQLRQHWTCPSEDPGKPDEAARLRREAAGRIVQIGAEADAQVKGLQKANEQLETALRQCIRSR